MFDFSRHSEGRISSVMNVLKTVSRWLPGRGRRVQGDGEDVRDGFKSDYEESKHLGRISRSADGRFVVESVRNSLASRGSSSDDGGFLSRRTGLRLRAFDRASWRRPLVAYPSELSLRSDGTGQSNFGDHNILKYLREKSPSPFFKVPVSPLTTPTSSVLAYGRRKGVGYAHSSASSMTRRLQTKSPSQASQSPYLQRLPQIPIIYSNGNYPTKYGVIFSPSLIKPTTPTTPRIVSSSPTNSNSLTPLWSPSYNFSDLSSVPVPSSAERSFPSSTSQQRPSGYLQLRNIHERYAQELPSLRAIHEETSRLPRETAFFMPVQPSPPRIRIPTTWNDYRSRSRLPPRHARQAQSAPELTSAHEDPVTSTGLLMETSPESRSSSSGFGSKNTSQQNQSSQSGSTTEWKVPPYRTPPPVKTANQPQIQIPPQYSSSFSPPLSSEFQMPYLIGDWFDLNTDIQEASPASDLTKLDASVDGHYEFDAAFPPTPTPPIPVSISYPRQTTPGDTFLPYPTTFYSAVNTVGTTRPKRTTKYDNIEARVQAMKEEYYAFRRRQEKRKFSENLESVC